MKARSNPVLAFFRHTITFLRFFYSAVFLGIIVNILFAYVTTGESFFTNLRTSLFISLFLANPFLTSLVLACVMLITLGACFTVLLEHRSHQESQREQRIFVKYREQLVNALSTDLAKEWQMGTSKLNIFPLRLRYYDEIHSMQQDFTEVSVEFALQKKRLFLLLGAPDSGKTTFLKYLALLSAQGLFRDVANLPVLIQLYQTKGIDNSDLKGMIQKTIAVYAGKQPKSEVLEKVLKQGRLLLLFDGLDETKDTSKVIESVLRFSKSYEHCQMVVTGKEITDHHFIRFQAHGFTNLSIQPLGDAELLNLINHWSLDYKVAAEMFWNTLQESPALLSAARNPLTLRLMLGQYREQNEVLGQVSLLTDISLKSLPQSYQQLPSGLSHLAEQLALDMSIGEKRIISFKDISIEAAKIDPQYANASKLEKALQALQEKCIIAKVNHVHYRFSHQLLQEYFSAQFLKSIETNQLLALCYDHAGNKRWESILSLIARERSDIPEIISNLLLSDSSNQWLLAAKCLRESIQTNPSLELETVKKLCDCLNLNYPEQAIRISNVLAQFRGKEIHDFYLKKFSGIGNDPLIKASLGYILAEQGVSRELLWDDLLKLVANKNSDVRYQTCRALGAIGTKSSIEILIRQLKEEKDAEVLLQILLEIERIGDLSKKISQSMLVVLLAELRRRSRFPEDKDVQDQIGHLLQKINNEISSNEER